MGTEQKADPEPVSNLQPKGGTGTHLPPPATHKPPPPSDGPNVDGPNVERNKKVSKNSKNKTGPPLVNKSSNNSYTLDNK